MLSMGTFNDFWKELMFPGKTEAGIMAMTGRRSLWEVYMHLFETKPFFGYGFGIVARIGSQFNTVSTTNAHNGLIEVALGTGLSGFLIIFIWLLRLLREIIVSLRNYITGIVGFIGAFTVASVNNMTIPIYGGAWNPTSTIFAVLMVFFIFYIRNRPANLK